MAHPYQAHRAGQTGRARVKRILKADGGGIDENIDVRSKEEMPNTVGPYGLGQTMQYQKGANERKESDEGKRFYDTGTRIPGSQKAKNDAYMSKRK